MENENLGGCPGALETCFYGAQALCLTIKLRRQQLHVVYRHVRGDGERDFCQRDASLFTVDRYQKLWKSYVKLRHLLANSPKVKQIDKQKLTQREVGQSKTKPAVFGFSVLAC